MTSEHWKLVISCFILLLFMAFVAPQCMVTPGHRASEKVEEYHQRIQELKDQIEPIKIPGGTGYGYTRTNPNGSQDHYGIGFSIGTGYMQHIDNTTVIDDSIDRDAQK